MRFDEWVEARAWQPCSAIWDSILQRSQSGSLRPFWPIDMSFGQRKWCDLMSLKKSCTLQFTVVPTGVLCYPGSQDSLLIYYWQVRRGQAYKLRRQTTWFQILALSLMRSAALMMLLKSVSFSVIICKMGMVPKVGLNPRKHTAQAHCQHLINVSNFCYPPVP